MAARGEDHRPCADHHAGTARVDSLHHGGDRVADPAATPDDEGDDLDDAGVRRGHLSDESVVQGQSDPVRPLVDARECKRRPVRCAECASKPPGAEPGRSVTRDCECGTPAAGVERFTINDLRPERNALRRLQREEIGIDCGEHRPAARCAEMGGELRRGFARGNAIECLHRSYAHAAPRQVDRDDVNGPRACGVPPELVSHARCGLHGSQRIAGPAGVVRMKRRRTGNRSERGEDGEDGQTVSPRAR
jgi:hypothetical protein